MKVIIDNGHGVTTPGKCSPDQSYREYAWTREIAWRLAGELEKRGIDCTLLVPGQYDVPLKERVRKVNEICDRLGRGNVLLVSIHSNASGRGEWMQAQGWCAYTSPGQTAADRLTDCLYGAAERRFGGRKIRRDMTDGDADMEANFYILAKTKCAAVLTENFFHDNRDDLAYITSDKGKQDVIAVHAEGIVEYIKQSK